MSEFKYACPVCGQHIKCDSSQSGTTMECPTCFQKITAPQAPATDDSKFIIAVTKVGERPMPAARAEAATPPAPETGLPRPAMVFVMLFFAAVVVAFAFHRTTTSKPGSTAPVAVGGVPETNSPTINLSEAGGGGRLALNKPALASTQESQNPAQNGNDGNPTTRWCATNGNVPQWWEVDLGGPAAITGTRIVWEHVAVYQYVIEVSSDRTNWPVVVDKSDALVMASTSVDDFSAHGRYVRLVIMGLQPGSWASFYEFEVSGSIVDNDGGGAGTNGKSTH